MTTRTPTLETRQYGTRGSPHGGPVTAYLYDGSTIGSIEYWHTQYYVTSTDAGYQGTMDDAGELFTRATAKAWIWAQSCFSKPEEA